MSQRTSMRVVMICFSVLTLCACQGGDVSAQRSDPASLIAARMAAEWTLKPLMLLWDRADIAKDDYSGRALASLAPEANSTQLLAVYIASNPFGRPSKFFNAVLEADGRSPNLERFKAETALLSALSAEPTAAFRDGLLSWRLEMAKAVNHNLKTSGPASSDRFVLEAATATEMTRFQEMFNNRVTSALASAFVQARSLTCQVSSPDAHSAFKDLQLSVLQKTSALDRPMLTGLMKRIESARTATLDKSREQARQAFQAVLSNSPDVLVALRKCSEYDVTPSDPVLASARAAAIAFLGKGM